MASRDAITQRWINVAKPDGWRAYLDSLWDSEHRHATPIKEGLSWKVQEIREATLWFSVASAAEIDARGSELTDSVTAPDQQLSE
jgi:hypothetical protein